MIALALVVAACGSGSSTGAGSPTPSPPLCSTMQGTMLEVCLRTRPAPPRARAEITWILDVRNGGSATVGLRFASGQSGNVQLLRNDGSEAYRWGRGKSFTQALRSETLEAGRSRSYELSDDADSFVRDPGSYQLRATLEATVEGVERPPPPITGALVVA